MEKDSIELQQGQTKEERPKILPLHNGPKVYLCRCGASNNKPFCDDMHRIVNFKDDKN